MQAPILVVLDASDTLDTLDTAAGLLGAASEIGTPIALVTDAAVAEQLGPLGAAKVLLADVPEDVLSIPLSDATSTAIAATQPAAILFANSVAGRDVAARVAMREQRALLTDVTGIRRDEEGIITDHGIFGGNYLTVGAATHGGPVVTVREGVDKQAAPQAGVVEPLVVEPSARRGARILSVTQVRDESPRPALRTADRVVAGGVALGSEEEFERLVGGLADALGAAVGATRDAVDRGFAPSETQVGQTGVMVSPQLYIALGLSGAVQHLVGMQTSDTIVAINNDADAAIFDTADFGIVGDVFEVVPQVLELLAQRKEA